MERIGLEPGSEVGGYRVVAPLGSGAMGAVYRALDGDGNAVALKVLHPAVAGDAEARARLRREVAVLRRVRHPGVARVLDAEADADDLFIVTELVEGPTLEDEVLGAGPLDASELFDLADQLRIALASVHEAGVIHRDLQASNVLLGHDGPVLIDFGISQAVGDARVTRTGLVMGTPAYLAPELVDGADPSETTDWWGWAAMLAFAATGRTPFGNRPVDVVIARARSGRPDLAGLGERTSRALAAALDPSPQRRTPPEEVVEQLRVARDEGEELTDEERAVLPAPGGPDAAPDQPPTELLGAPAAGTGTRVMPVAGAGGPGEDEGGSFDDGSDDVAPDDDGAYGDDPYRDDSDSGDASEADSGSAPVLGYSRPQLRRRAGTGIAVLLPFVPAAATWPGVTAVLLVLLALGCRVTGLVHYAFHTRRERRGVRPADAAAAAVRLPWHLLRAAAGLVPSILAAATAVALLGGVSWWLLDNEKIVGDAGAYQWVLLGCGGIVAALLWFGPLTYLTRLGGRVVVTAAVPRGWGVAVLWLVSIVVTVLLARVWLGDHPIVWGPFGAPPSLAR